MEIDFKRIGIWGVGLIGGSLGLAIKRADPRVQILGLGRDPSRLGLAKEMGAIDAFELVPGPGLRSCELVILATPVEHILQLLDTTALQFEPGTLITDAGSTKRSICRRAWKVLPESLEFIGGHPVAGREVTGVEHSLKELFERAPYVLCPQEGRSDRNLRKMESLVEGIGARRVVMNPEEHDRQIAWVSHLPQLISTALANVAHGKGTDISGSGLRDMLRLSGSSFAVWKGIFDSNADNVDTAMAGFIEQLEVIRAQLHSGDLEKTFDEAVRASRNIRERRG